MSMHGQEILIKAIIELEEMKQMSQDLFSTPETRALLFEYHRNVSDGFYDAAAGLEKASTYAKPGATLPALSDQLFLDLLTACYSHQKFTPESSAEETQKWEQFCKETEKKVRYYSEISTTGKTDKNLLAMLRKLKSLEPHEKRGILELFTAPSASPTSSVDSDSPSAPRDRTLTGSSASISPPATDRHDSPPTIAKSQAIHYSVATAFAGEHPLTAGPQKLRALIEANQAAERSAPGDA